MNCLEELFCILMEEDVPNTPEYRENRAVRYSLMDKVEKAMGEDMAEKVADAYGEWEEQQCRRFFRYGLRFGLELLRL